MSLTLLFNHKNCEQRSLRTFLQAHAGSYDALILDQDGTLLDNMALISWIDSRQINALLQHISGEKSRIFVHPEDLLAPEIRSQSFNEKARIIAERHHIDTTPFSVPDSETTLLRLYKNARDEISRILLEYLEDSRKDASLTLHIFPGAEKFLARHRKLGFPMAVGSSNEQGKLEATLHASGLAPYFTTAHGALHAYGGAYFTGPDGRETRRPVKPAPDIFLHAAERLGAAPERCIVVGDGDTDMIAARHAGMLGIGITPEITTISEYHKKAAFLMDNGAAIVVPSWPALDQITPLLLGKAPLTPGLSGPSL